MGAEEIERLRRRAEQERQRAATFQHPELVQATLDLAAKYDAIADAYQGLGRSAE